MSNLPNEEQPPIPLLDQLKRALIHHEAKTGKLKAAIKAVESNPEYESIYQLVKNARQ
jgi:hypothetical protein